MYVLLKTVSVDTVPRVEREGHRAGPHCPHWILIGDGLRTGREGGPLLPLEPGEHLMGSEALRAAERDPASQRRTPPSVGRAVSLPRLTRRGPHLASGWKPPEGLVNNADPRVPAPTPSAENRVGESQMLAWNRLPGRSWARSVGTRARARAGHVRAVEVLIHSFTHSLTRSLIRSFVQDSLGTERWVSRPGPRDRGAHIVTGAVQEADGQKGCLCVCVAGGGG